MGDIAPPPGSTLTALVVDDEQVVRMVLHRFLARRGWRVVEAETGERALELIAAERALADLVICDHHLPGVAGSVLCRRLAELRPSLAGRIVLSSGDPLGAERALRLEGLDCRVLGKPFTLDDLDRLLDALHCAA